MSSFEALFNGHSICEIIPNFYNPEVTKNDPNMFYVTCSKCNDRISCTGGLIDKITQLYHKGKYALFESKFSEKTIYRLIAETEYHTRTYHKEIYQNTFVDTDVKIGLERIITNKITNILMNVLKNNDTVNVLSSAVDKYNILSDELMEEREKIKTLEQEYQQNLENVEFVKQQIKNLFNERVKHYANRYKEAKKQLDEKYLAKVKELENKYIKTKEKTD